LLDRTSTFYEPWVLNPTEVNSGPPFKPPNTLQKTKGKKKERKEEKTEESSTNCSFQT